MALFWFEKLAHVVPGNSSDWHRARAQVAPDEVVQGAWPLDAGETAETGCPIEAVVRGYLARSGWKELPAEPHRVWHRPARRLKPQASRSARADLYASHQG